MRNQREYLNSNLISLDINGKFLSKQDRQKEHIKASYGLKTPIPTPTPIHIKKFNDFLNLYQEDINKIIGKYRGDRHYLSHEEIVSEVNLSLLKKRDELIHKFNGDFSCADFRKLAFSFVRNICRWTYSRIHNQSYVKRRIDKTHHTEDGFKSSFEFAVDFNGEEDPFFEDFDRNARCEYLIKMLKEYSGILTDQEITVLSMLEKGMKQEEISEILGVTRQAVSVTQINIFEKVRHYLSKSVINDHSFDSVSKGYESIKDFFSENSGYCRMQDEDKPLLKSFLLKNAKRLTSKEISEQFLKQKYSKRQIVAFAVKNKLSFCLIKSHPKKYSEKETKKVLNLFLNGHTTKEVAKIIKRSTSSVAGKRANFTFLGLLPRINKKR